MARRRMLSPINSVKHYVQRFITSVAVAAVLNDEIVNAVVASAVSDPTEVTEGAVIKAVFVEMWVIGLGAAGSNGSILMALEKLPAAATPMTNAQSLALMTYPNKKNILYSTQGLVASDEVGLAMAFIRQWFAIPKGKQRFGLGDKLILNVSSISATNFQICGFYTYKEYK